MNAMQQKLKLDIYKIIKEHDPIKKLNDIKRFIIKIKHINDKYRIFLSIFDDHIIQVLSKAKMYPLIISIKANICIKGWNTNAGSMLLKWFISPYDADVIKHIKYLKTDIKRDVLILGYTNLDEFAMGSTCTNTLTNRTINPHDCTWSAGGSSGGSASSVALKIVDFALGSSTGGSVNMPAAWCWIIGFKPTKDLISWFGLISFASSLDHIGYLLWVDTMKIFISYFQSYYNFFIKWIDDRHKIWDQNVFYNANKIHRMFTSNIFHDNIWIAYLDVTKFDFIDASIKSTYNSYIEKLKSLYAMSSIELPFLSHSNEVYIILSSIEAMTNLSWYDGLIFNDVNFNNRKYKEHFKLYRWRFSTNVKRRLMIGNFFSLYDEGWYKNKAEWLKRSIWITVENLLKKYNFIILPTVSKHALWLDKIDQLSYNENWSLDVFTSFVNLTRCPSISFPIPFKKDTSIQILSKRFGDLHLFYLLKKLIS